MVLWTAACHDQDGRVLVSAASSQGNCTVVDACTRALQAPPENPAAGTNAGLCVVQMRHRKGVRVYTLWPGGAYSFACAGDAGADDSHAAFALLGDLSARWDVALDRSGFGSAMGSSLARLGRAVHDGVPSTPASRSFASAASGDSQLSSRAKPSSPPASAVRESEALAAQSAQAAQARLRAELRAEATQLSGPSYIDR